MNGRFSRLEVSRDVAPQGGPDAEVKARGVPVRTVTDDLAQAREAVRRGRFEPALRAYTSALGRNRALVPAWVGQVQMLVELGEYAEARLWADKSLELFRNNGDLLAAKARACVRQGDRRAATECSDASVKSPGSSPARWQARGETMLSQSPARARDCFEKSLAEAEADWFDRVVIARAYAFHGLAAPALEFADAAVGLRPADPYAWLVLGRCQLAVGLHGRAEVSFTRAVELDPTLTDAGTELRRCRAVGPGQRLLRWARGVLRR